LSKRVISLGCVQDDCVCGCLQHQSAVRTPLAFPLLGLPRRTTAISLVATGVALFNWAAVQAANYQELETLVTQLLLRHLMPLAVPPDVD